MSPNSSVFALPDRLADKADPALIAADERHFRAIADALDGTRHRLTERLAGLRRMPGGHGEQAMERDTEIRRVTRELGALQRYGVDLCLGRMVFADGRDPVYVGRTGLTDDELDRLLVDWRSSVARPFFAASHGDPMGLVSRRRYRWKRGRIVDYWDEAFTAEGLRSGAALDDQSAFIAGLGDTRSPRMRDVLGTIQADQDAIIRAGSDGALVVDGGPGTGKTVVALHRAAYLLYADPRVSARHGGVLFVGPNHGYLDYVADVLPSLGEDGVRLATLADLVPGGVAARQEADSAVAALKADVRLTRAVEHAVRRHEVPPETTLVIETDWADVAIGPDEWADAFDAADPGTPHNESRAEVWSALLDLIAPRVGGAEGRAALAADDDLRATFSRAWPLLDPEGVLADLFSFPDHLARCAPTLDADEVRLLQRAEPRDWTAADLPLLDAARQRIGDPGAARRDARRAAALATERERMDRVIDDLIAADDSELGLMKMLRGADARNSLDDEDAVETVSIDEFAGPFAHVVVDEAQELTDAEWLLLVRRCPTRSFTVVGDRAQARDGVGAPWAERLARVGVRDVRTAQLRVNYRTPSEVMAVAEPVIRSVIPDANVPTSVRSSGIPVVTAEHDALDGLLDEWERSSADGVACVIGDPAFGGRERIRSLEPAATKGLEFDLVVLVDPDRWSAVDRYVAMTRATQRLVVLSGAPGPAVR